MADAEEPTEAAAAPSGQQEATEAAADGEPAETAVAEGVEIPKQQSAEQAADNEAGEAARK
ncbi:gliding motility protein [Streptomyces sp. UC4497]